MSEWLDKVQKMDGGKINGAAVALLTLVLFLFGNQMRSLPEKIEAMAITQKLLVYRIEQLENALERQSSANKAPAWGAPSLAAACGHFQCIGDGDALLAFQRPQPLPVRFQLDHVRAR